MRSMVVFDVGSTLIHPDFSRLAEWVLSSTGSVVQAVEVERSFRRAVNGDLGLPTTSARQNEGSIFFRSLGLYELLGAAEVRRLWRDISEGGGYDSWLFTVVDRDAVSTLTELRNDGHLLVAASNSDGSLRSELSSSGLFDFFDVILDSAVIGVEKPEPGFYRAVLNFAQCRRTLHVGDDLINDCVAAVGCGFDQALLYDPLVLLPGLPRYLRICALREVREALGGNLG